MSVDANPINLGWIFLGGDINAAAAARCSEQADRLLKMLRGDIVMRLEDIAMADLLLGEVSELARLPLRPLQAEAAKPDKGSPVDRDRVDYLRMLADWNRGS